jgi:cell division protein FtsW (lipid II flippase)
MAFIVPIWMLFAIGPACVLSNNAFSFAGMPAVWSWQIVWWTLGIVMMWALCFKCELSKVTDDQIQRAENEPNIVVEETT